MDGLSVRCTQTGGQLLFLAAVVQSCLVPALPRWGKADRISASLTESEAPPGGFWNARHGCDCRRQAGLPRNP